jgi:hypothetical protein
VISITRAKASVKYFRQFEGELRIVDPYCGERTLDVLSNLQIEYQVPTKAENLRDKERIDSYVNLRF